MNFHHNIGFSSLRILFFELAICIKNSQFSPQWWQQLKKCIITISFFQENIFHQSDEFSSLFWIFITIMNFHHYDEFSSLWWIFITMINFHHYDEFSSLWWIFICLSPGILELVMMYHNNELTSWWWMFLTKMSVFHKGKSWLP